MSEVTETGSFAVPADRLWTLVADFGGLADIMDGVEECRLEGEGVGAKRFIPGAAGTVVESLDVFEPENRTLVYSIIEGPLPFKDYSARMVVTEDGPEACTLTWTGTFEAAGIPVEKAERLAGRIYQGGIAGYRNALS
jgi:hypothetical protein